MATTEDSTVGSLSTAPPLSTEQQLDEIALDKSTLNVYRKALTYNVIGKYDPKITQLVYHTSHSVLYQFNQDSENWDKLEYEGVLSIYSRNQAVDDKAKMSPNYILNNEIYTYGLMILNRIKTENFCLGLLSNKNVIDSDMIVEKNDDLIILKNLKDETYGIWIFDKADRENMFNILNVILNQSQSI
ncbi:hypothetical protein PACTADRAFT_79685 [Pachysolen tannophilus NRRL Y-2460]|uniref:Uncharacterized protein n=1 Tax=Pachysolen tannophilus NRRL Y-2460 TaxID=669874 RepID=A0A1E4TZX1_PACTA|nr:hypothetical protein PACTADRAFT_79685 [Pachysolen tannophilus NRRL Y-2460]